MRRNDTIRVQLADDHEVVRAGFRHLLEMGGKVQIVAESASGKEACRDYKAQQPDILIMDISMPDMNGLDTMHRILLQDPDARILMLSMHTGIVAERAMQMGARGFVCKRSGAKELLTAIHEIMRGKSYLDRQSGIQLSGGQKRQEHRNSAPLTRRELEVCILLAEGKSVSEIAHALYLSEKTVYTHRQNIMQKLGVQTIVELIRVAERMGILSGE